MPLPAFRVVRAFYHGHLDSVVLSGHFEGIEPVGAGWTIDMPREIKGNGPVIIDGVNLIQFADGNEQLCLLVKYEMFASAPLLEFSDLEGLVLALRPR